MLLQVSYQTYDSQDDNYIWKLIYNNNKHNTILQ